MGKPTILAARMELVVAAFIAALLIVGLILADGAERMPRPVAETTAAWSSELRGGGPGDLRAEP